MGPSANLPGQYLDALVTHRAELGLVVGAILAAVVLWRCAPVSSAEDPAPGSGSAGPQGVLGGLVRAVGGVNRSSTAVTEPSSRTVLRLGFGALWVLDGILQAQVSMPRQFIPMVVEPALSGQPSWLAHLDRIGINLWTTHTVSTDAFTVFVQVAIGCAIMLGGDRAVTRLGLSLSIAWGLVVWTLGEAMGGILAPGATWLTGSPGAALFYVVAAVVLLTVPSHAWRDERVSGWLARGIGILWLVEALVQALPAEGFWQTGRLHQVFTNAASNPQPSFLARPISAMAGPAAHDPIVVNALVIVVMATLGVGLLSGRGRQGWLVAGFTWLFLSWWFGMDFGVVGGVGTDPNAAPPVALFAWSAWRALAARQHRHCPAGWLLGGTGRSKPPWWRPVLATWLCTAALVTTVWAAVPIVGELPAAAATPVAATPALVDSGGLASVPGSPVAPDVHLVNQYGRPRQLSSWRGKVVILSFLDPLCYKTCPVVAEELAQVAALLDARRSQLEFVAINANPDFRSPAVLRNFDREHGISSLANWAFLTGSRAQLRAAWHAYGTASLAPQVGMVAHSLLVFIIGPTGREVSLTQATGVPGPTIEASYAQLFSDAVGRLLPRA